MLEFGKGTCFREAEPRNSSLLTSPGGATARIFEVKRFEVVSTNEMAVSVYFRLIGDN
jgi:hypothetical protein